ncbi:MAG: hypothetical protein HC880_18445, partial [Bacteroidia bacterium]|nr:hypothetical protein [Bacteroidia bacterium]
FLSDDRMYRAKFTEQAEWVNTRSAIPREEMPRNALDFLKTNYPDALINGYQYYESPGGQFYEVMISMDSQEKNLHFDKEGNISKIQGDMEVNRESGQ